MGNVGNGWEASLDVRLADERRADELRCDRAVLEGEDDGVALAEAVRRGGVGRELQPRRVAEAEGDVLPVGDEVDGDVGDRPEHDLAPTAGVLGHEERMSDGARGGLADRLGLGKALLRVREDPLHGLLEVETVVHDGDGIDAERGGGDDRRLPGAVETTVVEAVDLALPAERERSRVRLHGALGRQRVAVLLAMSDHDDPDHLSLLFLGFTDSGPHGPNRISACTAFYFRLVNLSLPQNAVHKFLLFPFLSAFKLGFIRLKGKSSTRFKHFSLAQNSTFVKSKMG